jgi:hypothetical protein
MDGWRNSVIEGEADRAGLVVGRPVDAQEQ